MGQESILNDIIIYNLVFLLLNIISRYASLDYKLELVKARLLYTDLTISQIVFELNFTDESHLNKVFKKKYRMTAKQYKNKKIKF